MTKRVLIAGASGLVGYAAARHFATLPGWEAVGVSRRVPAGLPEEAELLSVDLLDEEACERAFGAMSSVTHLVYAALQEVPGLMPGWVDPEVIERNARMLRNLFEPLSRAASNLEHVSLLHGDEGVWAAPPERRGEGCEGSPARAGAAPGAPQLLLRAGGLPAGAAGGGGLGADDLASDGDLRGTRRATT